MAEMERQTHEFEPVYDEHSKVLILGTFPSVKSRENQFYYGHPQNRFWKVIAALTVSEVPETVEEKKKIYANGNTAKKLYDKYVLPKVQMEIEGLPSTSPANAGYSLERLLEAWKVITL